MSLSSKKAALVKTAVHLPRRIGCGRRRGNAMAGFVLGGATVREAGNIHESDHPRGSS